MNILHPEPSPSRHKDSHSFTYEQLRREVRAAFAQGAQDYSVAARYGIDVALARRLNIFDFPKKMAAPGEDAATHRIDKRHDLTPTRRRSATPD